MGVVLDCDGPLACQLERNRRWGDFCRRRKIPWDVRLFYETGDWSAVTGLTPAELAVQYVEFRQESKRLGVDKDVPTPGAREAVARLNGRNKFLATARANAVRHETLQFLWNYLGLEFQRDGFGLQGQKAAWILDHCPEAQWFVEDSLEEATRLGTRLEAAANRTFQILLFPVPGCPRRVVSDRIVCLPEEQLVEPTMSNAAWCDVCQQAWQRLTDIILSTSERL